MDLNVTQANLDRLDQMIATGARTASFDGKDVTFRSLDDLLRTRKLVADSLSGSSTAPRTVLAKVLKGTR